MSLSGKLGGVVWRRSKNQCHFFYECHFFRLEQALSKFSGALKKIPG
jgi:hypothetical protein